ncbi:MAG TPA: PEP-CTERM sorting domain-containing protein [Phycisphaerae bacterium]|nr:PEP-CTERM sorting domain-containing protein [Phycisphaerae bacterium]
MLNRFHIVAALSIAAVSAAGATASAAVTTLDQLDHGGSITEGNATYSNFQYPNTGGSGDQALDSTVTVATSTAANGEMDITFGRTSGQVWTNGQQSVITYDVTFAQPVPIVALNFIANGSGGAAFVGETIVNLEDSNPNTNSFTLPDGQGGSGLFDNGGNGSVDSILTQLPWTTSHIQVTKSIDTVGSATITSVTNGYVPVPEPASLGILSAAGFGLLARRRRTAR